MSLGQGIHLHCSGQLTLLRLFDKNEYKFVGWGQSPLCDYSKGGGSRPGLPMAPLYNQVRYLISACSLHSVKSGADVCSTKCRNVKTEALNFEICKRGTSYIRRYTACVKIRFDRFL